MICIDFVVFYSALKTSNYKLNLCHMEIKKFRNKYDLELIPASTENIILGTMVWNPIIGKPNFAHHGMPEHIFSAFWDADMIDQDECEKLMLDSRNSDLVDANLAETVIDVDVNLATTLEHPEIGKIENSFELNNIKKFTFGDISARTMSYILRHQIDDFLEELKKNKWERYDSKIRRVFVITELYYGSMKLIIDNQFKDKFSTTVSNTDLEIKNELEVGKSTEYTFDNKNVPFAMRIERIRDFN